MLLYNPTISGSLAVTGSLTTTGTITSQTLVVQTITSSVSYLTGSTQHGSVIGNTHQFTGSVSVSGSVTNNGLIFNTNSTIFDTTGSITKHSVVGLVVRGTSGSAFDYSLYSAGGTALMTNPTSTNNINFNSGQVWFNGGNVGIGTTSPGQLLEVVGGEIKAGRVDSTNEGGQVSFGRATDNNTAWYIDSYGNVASPQLRFVDVTGAAVRMTLTGSNVGIGTSTPVDLLHIKSATSYGSIRIDNTGANGGGGVATMQNGSVRALFGVSGWIEGNSTSDAAIFGEGGAGGNIRFYTNGSATEKMRLTNTGNLVIGTTNESGLAKLIHINDPNNCGYRVSISGTARGYVYADNSNVFYLESSNSARIRIWVNSANGVYMDAGATSFTSNSDERLKTDLNPITDAINKVLQLRSVTGRFKTDDESVRRSFLIAQDVQSVLPEAVTEDKETGILGVQYTEVIPLLVASIKEQQAKITSLEEILQRNNIQ